MKYINTFSKDVAVSQVALGCMRISSMSDYDMDNYINTALDCGYNYFDHADIYANGESERVFGNALKRNKGAKEKMIIQTKCGITNGMYDFSKKHILESVDSSLMRLGVDHIDVLLLHRPDLLMDPEEVASAFDTLYESKKVLNFGVSNHNPMQIELLKKYVNQPIVINQMQLSIPHAYMISSGANVNMDNKDGCVKDGYLRDYCRINDITIQPWSPLQKGFIAGAFLTDDTELNRVLREIADKYGITDTGLSIAWLLRLPEKMQPVVGSTNLDRIKAIAKAADITLSAEDWYTIYKAAGYPLP